VIMPSAGKVAAMRRTGAPSSRAAMTACCQHAARAAAQTARAPSPCNDSGWWPANTAG
jgi:hypothetical protein